MPTKCFIKRDSEPPVCGVHNVKLVEHQTSREGLAGGVGNFTFLARPVSGQVFDDASARTKGTTP
jgi:hypothetical protein